MADQTQTNSFSCCLIGGDTLLTQCGESLLKAGHTIKLIVTDAAQVAAWAATNDIETIPVSTDYTARLDQLEFDYLFAITHLAIIPDAAINTPVKGAINFHDGPLPAYAGLNTPMWALLNGEESYGVTWHVMATGIDTGDILIQEPVALNSDDTAVSLNTKCFTAALDSFHVLLDQLVSDTLQPRAQDLSVRKYFARADRPDNFCVLDWRKPALELERLVRALNTGRYENTLGSAKVLIGDQAYIVDSATVIDDLTDSEPGTILKISSEGFQVACGKETLEIGRVETLQGGQVQLGDLAISVGDQLAFGLKDSDKVTDLAVDMAKAEPFWARRLTQTQLVTIPHRDPSAKADTSLALARRDISIPEGFPTNLIPGAFATFLARLTGSHELDVAVYGGLLSTRAAACEPLATPFGIARFEIELNKSVMDEARVVEETISTTLARQPWLKDLVARRPALRANEFFSTSQPLPVAIVLQSSLKTEAELVLRLDAEACCLEFMQGPYSATAMDRITKQFESWLLGASVNIAARGCEVDLLTSDERERLLVELNATSTYYDHAALMYSDFEKIAADSPDKVAVVAAGQSLSYGELNTRATCLAAELNKLGAGPDILIGVHLVRSVDLMVATLGVLKSGAAYVPLDPAFPSDRIAFMIEDSAMPIIITQSSLARALPDSTAELLVLDSLTLDKESTGISASTVQADNLAYVIYTSGSTGKPKGVMLEHRNVVNFFTAMDKVIPDSQRDDKTWLAVTSLSFDISVLELFWTLNRGFKVVIFDEGESRNATEHQPTKALDMGLFMWGNDDASGPDKYKLLIEGAKFFDANGFSAIWTPERHFHAFGGPYPNPAVTGAAVATITENIKIRAGSCVVPLHHPLRIAEEWSVVDNLSNGRVEIAAASGWNPTDFVLKPENHANNKQVMFDQLEQVRALWRGEKLSFEGPMGEVELTSLPRPVQAELPCWITTAGNPETWAEAGRLGLHVLTHLLGQTLDEVAEKVTVYRAARAAAGFDPDAGQVALMLHTYVSEDVDAVRELVREPMKEYLSSSMKLAMDYAWSFPAFKRPGGDVSKPEDVDLKNLSEEEVDTILSFAFERYFENSGLFGNRETCLDMLRRCGAAGVDEIACLMDFGVPTQAVLDSLPALAQLRVAMVESAAHTEEDIEPQQSFGDLVDSHKVTHLQCTPSAARMYLADEDARRAFAAIDHLMLGGEALPSSLAREIKSINPGTLTNMYGPTETTIWSMTSAIANPDDGISIGTPIANTQVYVLDKYRQPVPAGIPGELFIAGDGVARGYLNRPELTAERFTENTFGPSGARLYATGDLVSYCENGNLQYIGRTDFQVKVRGYRIELGEIESRLESHDAIAEAAVIVRSADDTDQRLTAFVVAVPHGSVEPGELRATLREALPEYMVPNEFVTLEFMPRTANGKLDRKKLAELKPATVRRINDDAAPASDTEKTIAELWRKVLKLDAVGLNENFFDLGGHSLLVVQLHGQLKETLTQPVSLTDLYQYTTIKSLSEFLTSGADNKNVKRSASRGEQRRALRRRRTS